jgi:hypothetical protein
VSAIEHVTLHYTGRDETWTNRRLAELSRCAGHIAGPQAVPSVVSLPTP